MLDPKLLREKPDLIRDMLKKRGVDFPLDELLSIDKQRRELMTEAQRLKHTRNLVAEKIAIMKKNKEDASKAIEEMRNISRSIEEIDNQVNKLHRKFRELMLRIPNLIDDSVPYGKDENDNVIVRTWGKPKEFDAKDHIDLAYIFDLIDMDRAAKISGSRFYILKNDLVRLNIALINFALDFISKKGYSLIQPPYMINRKAMEGAVILSDFADVIYKIEDEDLYLIGTAEHAIASMHMDEIIMSDNLPLRYAGFSPCFRKEAGAHGRDTKGIFRVHQFEKVEQFVFSKPEDSWNEHESMLKNAEEFFQLLEIPYRIVLLCSGDLGNVSAKTFDLEGWFPGQRKYRELVSCSNCLDYQARRLMIRYKDKPNEESRYLHTLNSTLVATERTIVAIMENYQTDDGIIIPKVLREYMNEDKISFKE
ncbi:MAG: serine--tRNA ligase [Candidatus Nitrosocaldaceae archaeon]|nr:MAG: serine--tRNA ligase [Candidatus Nitrosocaldaceae archaeon]